jgi:ketosteroid isomerase-like protein
MNMSDAKQNEVLACEEARRNAMLRSDVAALDRLVADVMVYTHSSGGKDTKASWLSKLTDGSLRYDALTFSDLKVTVVNDTALLTGRMHATAVHSGQPRTVDSLYLAVWVRQPGGWQLVAAQGTPTPAKP